MLRAEGSRDSIPEELDLFNIPSTESAVEQIEWVDIKPSTPFDQASGAPVNFHIPGDGSKYIDLSRSMLYMSCILYNEDKESTAVNDVKAIVTNMPLHTIWKQVDVMLNGVKVSSKTDNYGYKALMETLLYYDKTTKQSQLQSAGYYKDRAGTYMDLVEFPREDIQSFQKGFSDRHERFSFLGSDVTGPLHADVCQPHRLLLNGVSVDLSLYFNKQDFYMLYAKDVTEKHNFRIDDIYFRPCMVTVNPSVMAAHAQLLKQMPAQYPFVRTEMSRFVLPLGTRSFSENVFGNILPDMLLIAFVKEASYEGDKYKNPFNFVLSKISGLRVMVDGESTPYQRGYDRFKQADANAYNKNKTAGGNVTGYYGLFQGLDKDGADKGSDITFRDYEAGGYALFPFQLQSNLSKGKFPLMRSGELTVEGRFNEPLAESLVCLVMTKSSDMYTIDESRRVTV